MADNKPAHGEFCWNELMTRDTAAAGKFYSELIGWKTVDGNMPGMQYTLFKTVHPTAHSVRPDRRRPAF